MNNIELRCSKCGRFFCELKNTNDDCDFILKIKCQRSKCKVLNLFPIGPKISSDFEIYDKLIEKIKPIELRCRICDRFMILLFINNDKSEFSLSIKCQRPNCKALNLISFGPRQIIDKVGFCEVEKCVERK